MHLKKLWIQTEGRTVLELPISDDDMVYVHYTEGKGSLVFVISSIALFCIFSKDERNCCLSARDRQDTIS